LQGRFPSPPGHPPGGGRERRPTSRILSDFSGPALAGDGCSVGVSLLLLAQALGSAIRAGELEADCSGAAGCALPPSPCDRPPAPAACALLLLVLLLASLKRRSSEYRHTPAGFSAVLPAAAVAAGPKPAPPEPGDASGASEGPLPPSGGDAGAVSLLSAFCKLEAAIWPASLLPRLGSQLRRGLAAAAPKLLVRGGGRGGGGGCGGPCPAPAACAAAWALPAVGCTPNSGLMLAVMPLPWLPLLLGGTGGLPAAASPEGAAAAAAASVAWLLEGDIPASPGLLPARLMRSGCCGACRCQVRSVASAAAARSTAEGQSARQRPGWAQGSPPQASGSCAAPLTQCARLPGQRRRAMCEQGAVIDFVAVAPATDWPPYSTLLTTGAGMWTRGGMECSVLCMALCMPSASHHLLLSSAGAGGLGSELGTGRGAGVQAPPPSPAARTVDGVQG